MRKIKELKSTDLTFKLNASQFNFKTTDDISGYNGIIGQKRALETVEAALEMPQKGFNLYELSLQRNSLEDVFHSLTTDSNEENTAKGGN